MKEALHKLHLSPEVLNILESCEEIIIPKSREDLLQLCLCNSRNGVFTVSYDVENVGEVKEAEVVKCKNGIVVNYFDDYMRRRDPDCLLVADDNDTDKPRYDDVFKDDFEPLRQETFEWLKNRKLIVMPFRAGGLEYGYDALLVAPANAAFFAGALADLQGLLNIDTLREDFKPRAAIFLAPPFRHTHFNGRQIVVHNRKADMHEVFSYNLYPGPSAKKGIYGVLINIGEIEGWITVHASTVKIITPYDNEIVMMHEGASGGGKSEMIENIHKEPDGRILLGTNLETGEKYFMDLKETCELRPVTDDMALCHPLMQNQSRKLVVRDAEQGWFLRLDHINGYGVEPHIEKICTQPKEPLLFLNLQGIAGATCLIWDHTIDSDGKPCPNPRVIMPRRMIPNIVEGEVEVDARSFGVRTPPCTMQNPSYGILGLFHVIPPALAWLWRLVAPRGHNNPSITAAGGMTSEGVGSYWPFATGKMVEQANLLLEQIIDSSQTRYFLIPNQHIGVYKVGFMPQWIAREYIARRGSAHFKPNQLKESRCSLLGYSIDSLKVDGHYIRKALLQPEMQAEVGLAGYDKGAAILREFFQAELKKFIEPKLSPLGREIIQACFDEAPLAQYEQFIPAQY